MSMGELRRMYLVQEWNIGVYQANLGRSVQHQGKAYLQRH